MCIFDALPGGFLEARFAGLETWRPEDRWGGCGSNASRHRSWCCALAASAQGIERGVVEDTLV